MNSILIYVIYKWLYRSQKRCNKKCQISFYMLCFYTAPEAYLLFISKAFSNICAAHILSHFLSILRCRYWYSRNVFTICNFMTNNFTAKYAYYIQRFYKLDNEKRKSEIATCFIHFKQKNTKRTFCISVLNLPKHNKKYHKIVFRSIDNILIH